jgi:hypothetical protein
MIKSNFLKQSSQSGPYKIIGDTLRKKPSSLYKTIDEMLKIFQSGKYAYTSVSKRIFIGSRTILTLMYLDKIFHRIVCC